jgi:protein-tyrosine phosphatase
VSEPISVLFICLGNICRSPLAEAVFREAVRNEGLTDRFDIDSAGTSGYHDGEPPDRRTSEVALSRGVKVTGASRRVTRADVERFDYLVAMDASNRAEVERLVASTESDRPVLLLREFDPRADGDLDVPDPYFGGPRGFEDVHEMVDRSARALLEELRRRHDL